MAYISIGDRLQDIERLVGALADIKRLYSRDGSDLISGNTSSPNGLIPSASILCRT